jgi:hypothetical protein
MTDETVHLDFVSLIFKWKTSKYYIICFCSGGEDMKKFLPFFNYVFLCCECGFFGMHCNVQFGGWVPTFWRYLLLPSYSRILAAVHHTAQHYIAGLESWNSYCVGASRCCD